MKVVFLLTILVCCSVVYGKNGFRIDDKCLKCLDETKTIAEDILKIAIGVVPVTTCGGLCALVKNIANNSVAAELVCNGVCDAIGFKEFYKRFNNTILNYGEYCEKTKKCPKGNGTGTIISASVNSPITLGQDINIQAIISVGKEFGLTEFLFECSKNKTKPDIQYWSPLNVGGWKAEWSIPTGNNWKVGKYICDLKVCNTICDSFPKETDLGMKPLTFEIIKGTVEVQV